MSGHPMVIAGPSGSSQPHFAYENAITVREQWAPWAKAWQVVGATSPTISGVAVSTAEPQVYSSSNTLACTQVIGLNSRFDLTNTPAAGGFRVAEFELEYERNNASDGLLFELRRRDRSTGQNALVDSWDESAEFTNATGTKTSFSTSVSHDLDLESYDYYLLLKIDPTSADVDVIVYSIDLAFAMGGVQP